MINLAVIGLDYWGRRHVESAQASGRFKTTRAIDTDFGNEQLKAFAYDYGIALSATLDNALDDPAIDAISLATPHNAHPEQIKEAAGANKHVYTERPFALFKAPAEEAITACRQAGGGAGSQPRPALLSDDHGNQATYRVRRSGNNASY